MLSLDIMFNIKQDNLCDVQPDTILAKQLTTITFNMYVIKTSSNELSNTIICSQTKSLMVKIWFLGGGTLCEKLARSRFLQVTTNLDKTEFYVWFKTDNFNVSKHERKRSEELTGRMKRGRRKGI